MDRLAANRVEQAIRDVKRGDADAYAVVIEAFQRRLRAAVAGWCPPSVDPDEISHVAFVKAYQNIDSYIPDTDFYSWLCAFAQNLVRAEYKKIERESRNIRNYLDHVLLNALESEDLDLNREKERIEALAGCLENLPDKSRSLVKMRYSRGISLVDIARRRKRSVSAVKYHLFAIRKKLRECIGRKLLHLDGEKYETG
jgi:RNA polymerase sigma-70 factor (ECF subfamily)